MKTVILSVTVLAWGATAQERGVPLFNDDFGTHMTFAENWVVKPVSAAVSRDGKIVFAGDGALATRLVTPEAFWAEADFAFTGARGGAGFGGFKVGSVRFGLAEGNACALKEGAVEKWRRAVPDMSARLAVVRYTLDGKTILVCHMNDAEVYRLKLSEADAAAALEIVCAGGGLAIDDYALSAVRRDGESPNLLTNSSFEYAYDGYPFGIMQAENDYDYLKAKEVSYEDYFETVTLDKRAKHSGEVSLKIINDGRSARKRVFNGNGSGTKIGPAGVFSVWMKADRADFPVSLHYGGRFGSKTVRVGMEWARYEVVNTNWAGTAFSFSFNEMGTLWVDDMQAEILDERAVAAGSHAHATFASPYQPSHFDKTRYAKYKMERTPGVSVPRLPPGVEPGIALDEWKEHAAKTDVFYKKETLLSGKTEGFFACDDKNVYVGIRDYALDAWQVELLIDPTGRGDSMKHFQLTGRPDGTTPPNWCKGYGQDLDWKGGWRFAARKDAANNRTDYLFTLPFAEFARPELGANWLMSINRYGKSDWQVWCTAKCKAMVYRNPQSWPIVALPAAVVRPYALGVEGGGMTKDAITLELANNSGSARAVKVELSAGGNTEERAVELLPGQSTVSFSLDASAAIKAGVRVTEAGRPLANQLVILDARPPVTALGRLSFYMNEPEAAFRVKTVLPDPVKLTAEIACAGKTLSAPAAASFEMKLPLADIPTGTNLVTITLRDAAGGTVGAVRTSLVKRPYWAGASQINRFSRSLIHHGKPVVPFAPFLSPMGFWGWVTPEIITGQLDSFARYGFRHVIALSALQNKKYHPLIEGFFNTACQRGFSVLSWTMTDDKSGWAERFADLALLDGYTNILSQVVMDEPDLSMTSDAARHILRTMRPRFPYHPVQMNNSVLAIPQCYAGLETDILMIDDYLTNTEGRDVASVVEGADLMWQAGKAEGKPIFFFLVGANNGHRREPSYSEQIAQSYGCLAAGCSGLAYFTGSFRTPGNWRAMVQLNREAQALTDVICSEEEGALATCDGSPKYLRHRTKRHDGSLYIVSCNIDADPAGKVTFTLPDGSRYADKAEVLFEERAVPIRDGTFADGFTGHARHVYKIGIKEKK